MSSKEQLKQYNITLKRQNRHLQEEVDLLHEEIGKFRSNPNSPMPIIITNRRSPWLIAGLFMLGVLIGITYMIIKYKLY